MRVRIQREPFDAGTELNALIEKRGDIGASVTFVGQVREFTDGQPLDTLTLEHYPGMAEAELGRIVEEAVERFGVTDCLAVHRYGELRPGDPIVLVIATAPSRGPAFEAASFVMDYLKTSAPFWKKEADAKGERWVEARASDDVAAARWNKP